MNKKMIKKLENSLLELIHNRLGYEGNKEAFFENAYEDYIFQNSNNEDDFELKYLNLDNRVERRIVEWAYSKLIFGIIVHKDYNLRVAQRILCVYRQVMLPRRRGAHRRGEI